MSIVSPSYTPDELQACWLRGLLHGIGFDLTSVEADRRQAVLAAYVPTEPWSERAEIVRGNFVRMPPEQFTQVWRNMEGLKE